MSEVETIAKSHNWNMPTVCPVCGGTLELNTNHSRLYCTNEFCPTKSTGTIMKWCDVHGIKELGLTTLEKIQEQGYFRTISGMYNDTCHPECNSKMFSLLGKNWHNIIAEIDSHRETTLAKFLAGYNISGLGEKSVQKILSAHSIESFDQLYDSTMPDRFTCDGIGYITSNKFSIGLDKARTDMEKTLRAVRLVQEEKHSGSLDGKSFCFTGAMEYKRKDLQDMVTQNGGINKDSVTKDLTYLVIQDPNSTSGKAKKARDMGITLISPEQFLSMCKS